MSRCEYAGKTEAQLLKEGRLARGEYIWTASGNPHTLRREQIRNKYRKEIDALNGPDIRQAVFATACILLQFWMASWVGRNNPSFLWLLCLTYAVSATMNHSLFLAMHELSHLNFWPEIWQNKAHAVLANLAMGIPASSAFFLYHMDHHVYFGVDGHDGDIPLPFEANMWKKLGKFGRAMFVICSPISYTLRPFYMRPKKVTTFDVVNYAVVIGFNLFIWQHFGWKALFYLLAGSVLGLSIHPFCGHLVAEHFQWPWGEPFQETFSYYGILNYFVYNVGYHNEHHDFPRVSGFRLPEVRRIAKEFYALPHHDSWIGAIWEFINADDMELYARIKRKTLQGGDPNEPMKAPKPGQAAVTAPPVKSAFLCESTGREDVKRIMTDEEEWRATIGDTLYQDSNDTTYGYEKIAPKTD